MRMIRRFTQTNHNWIGPIAVYLVVVVIIIFVSGCATVACKTPLPKKEQLLGEWVGFTADDLMFIRLRLEPNGTGLCARVFMYEPPVVLAVVRWHLDKRKLIVSAVPLDTERRAAEAWAMTFVGRASAGSALHLNAYDCSGRSNWGREVILMREHRLIAALGASRDVMLQREEGHISPVNSATSSRGEGSRVEGSRLNIQQSIE
jgi:hypothetical protein